MTTTVASIKSNTKLSAFSAHGEGLQRHAAKPLQQTLRLHNRASSGLTRQSVSLLAAFRSANPVVTGISGNGTQTTTSVRGMHSGGTWEFFNNGQFRFTPAGLGTFARTDLYPIVGNFNQSGGAVNFSGSRRSSNLTSRNFAAVTGTLFASNGGVRANISQRTALTNAAYVNGTSFGNTIDRTVTLSMAMVRIA